ncbi:MAG: acetyl-CoA C-acyltransferase FadI [Deltaproteobacteria bacterium]|nr:acetyl-CoA C-acyltransferase FadI [Deltaproteobacteria bacterium]
MASSKTKTSRGSRTLAARPSRVDVRAATPASEAPATATPAADEPLQHDQHEKGTNGGGREALPIVVRTPARRVAIVAGLRTPFARRSTELRDLSALDLGRLVVGELVARTSLEPDVVEQVVFGQVVPNVTASNVAREVVLASGLPRSTDAYSVSRACATSLQALVSVAQSIEGGLVRCGIAGGADSASDVPIPVPRRLADALMASSRARNWRERVTAFRDVRPRDLVPSAPAPREPSTGMTMGEHAETMARDFGITRERQDAYAHRSHGRARAAWNEGRFDDDVMRLYVPPRYEAVTTDNAVRDDELAAYGALPPAFDGRHGTITAATSAPLTDGAAVLLLMREDRAKELGLSPLGFLRSYAFAALDPREHMLMGPAYATPLALERAGVAFADVDLVEMHEAFAAQVLCNVEALGSEAFARDRLGRSSAVGQVSDDQLNPNGGSLAFGHPFAATGARLVLGALTELRRRGKSIALCTTCAQGGLGAAVVLEAAS